MNQLIDWLKIYDENIPKEYYTLLDKRCRHILGDKSIFDYQIINNENIDDMIKREWKIILRKYKIEKLRK